jgi:UDP-N-acetylmuramate dehydrogenase
LEDHEAEVLVGVGSGVLWDDFLLYCVEQGWQGVECLSLIPGEVGAAAVQNIGAYGAEVADCIETVSAVHLSTGQSRLFANAECRYSYRSSSFKEDLKGQYFIAEVVFRLCKSPTLPLSGITNKALAERLSGQPQPLHLETVREAVIALRREKLPDPAKWGNAGSFFMNPVLCRPHAEALHKEYPTMPLYDLPVADYVKTSAAWLIEQCGWKGKRLGRAGVWDKQPLVLVNLGGATAQEIVALAEAIQRDVKARFGIDLHPEVNYIGTL